MRLRALLLAFALAGAGASLALAESSPPRADALRTRLAALGLDCCAETSFEVKGTLVSFAGGSLTLNVLEGSFAGKQISVSVLPDLTQVVRFGDGAPAPGDRAFAVGRICRAADGPRFVARKVATRSALAGDGHPGTTSSDKDRGERIPIACAAKGPFQLKGLVVSASGGVLALEVDNGNALGKSLSGTQASVTVLDGWTKVFRRGHGASLSELVAGDRVLVLGRVCQVGDGVQLVARGVLAAPAEGAARSGAETGHTGHPKPVPTEAGGTETGNIETVSSHS